MGLSYSDVLKSTDRPMCAQGQQGPLLVKLGVLMNLT